MQQSLFTRQDAQPKRQQQQLTTAAVNGTVVAFAPSSLHAVTSFTAASNMSLSGSVAQLPRVPLQPRPQFVLRRHQGLSFHLLANAPATPRAAAPHQPTAVQRAAIVRATTHQPALSTMVYVPSILSAAPVWAASSICSAQ